jgi:hypothetical protein
MRGERSNAWGSGVHTFCVGGSAGLRLEFALVSGTTRHNLNLTSLRDLDKGSRFPRSIRIILGKPTGRYDKTSADMHTFWKHAD